MILPLLKKLRIIRRTLPKAIDNDFSRSNVRSPGSPGLPGVGTRIISGKNTTRFATFLGLAFSLTPILFAQQFQAPPLPSPPPAAMAQAILQSKIDHAEALKAQMIRAQREQGASDEFANKAFEAQQNYLAEQAFLEYNAYVKKQAESATRPAAYTAPAQYLPKPETTAGFNQPARQPRTFMPPVHIAPVAKPTGQDGFDPLQLAGYQEPVQQPQANQGPRYSVVESQVNRPQMGRQGQVPIAYRASRPAVALPQYANAYPNAETQSNTNPAPDQYIFQENGSVGLQDRIVSMLSKPRYRSTSSQGSPTLERQAAVRQMPQASQRVPTPRQARIVQARTYQASQVQVQQPKTPPEFVSRAERKPDQPLYSPQVNQRMVSWSNGGRNEQDVRQTYEMQQRMEKAIHSRQQRAVQQATLMTPTQDPFNDQSMTMPRAAHQPRRAPNSQDLPRPMKQVSILSKGLTGRARQQENTAQDDGQFGVPSEDRSTQPGLDITGSQREPANSQDQPQVEDMFNELDQEMQRSKDFQDSVVEDEGDDGNRRASKKRAQKTCDEFRNQLLNGTIRDIALDISPPASKNRDQYVAISRSWTDRIGNIIATGSMVDLRRGYVIIDGLNGQLKIPYSKLSDADWAAVSDYWQIPELCSVGDRGDASRYWIPQTYTWKASSLCHKPLFFENIQLERYGHSHGPFSQPVHSVAHFFVSLIKVPYQSAISPANECQYALGFYRPGDCAPWLKDPIPISLSGASRQVLATTGLAFIP